MNKDNVKAIRQLLGYTTDLRVKLPYTIGVKSRIYDFIDKNMSLFTNITYEDDSNMYDLLLNKYMHFVIDPSLLNMYR